MMIRAFVRKLSRVNLNFSCFYAAAGEIFDVFADEIL